LTSQRRRRKRGDCVEKRKQKIKKIETVKGTWRIKMKEEEERQKI
jgi:hypothetical protein